MQIEFNMRSKRWHIISVMLMLIVLCMSCNDDNSETDSPSQPFDPSKPVVVSDFTPKEGGAYQKIVISDFVSLTKWQSADYQTICNWTFHFNPFRIE